MSGEDEYYYEDDSDENESLRDSDEDLGFNTAAEFEDTSRQVSNRVPRWPHASPSRLWTKPT